MKFRLHILAICGAALLIPAVTLTADSADSTEKPKATEKQAKPKKQATARCESVTGSRLRPKKGAECLASASAARSYSAEELENTGKTDLNEALQKADPSFR